jgi:hypothetical protein
MMESTTEMIGKTSTAMESWTLARTAHATTTMMV